EDVDRADHGTERRLVGLVDQIHPCAHRFSTGTQCRATGGRNALSTAVSWYASSRNVARSAYAPAATWSHQTLGAGGRRRTSTASSPSSARSAEGSAATGSQHTSNGTSGGPGRVRSTPLVVVSPPGTTWTSTPRHSR